MSEYSVYIHTNKANNYKYVGVTSQKPETRWQGGHGYRKQAVFWNAIMKYGWENFAHEVVATGLSAEAAWEMERRLIEELHSADREHGYNRSTGGEAGAKGATKSAKNREATSQALRRLWDDPEFRTRHAARTAETNRRPEVRATRSASQIGHEMTEETRKKISDAKRGKQLGPFTDEHRRRLRENHRGGADCRPVRCVETGTVYNSINDAARATGINKKGISGCCRRVKHYNTAGGFRWKFEG